MTKHYKDLSVDQFWDALEVADATDLCIPNGLILSLHSQENISNLYSLKTLWGMNKLPRKWKFVYTIIPTKLR